MRTVRNEWHDKYKAFVVVKVDILNNKCDAANFDMNSNDLDCLKCSFISFICK